MNILYLKPVFESSIEIFHILVNITGKLKEFLNLKTWLFRFRLNCKYKLINLVKQGYE